MTTTYLNVSNMSGYVSIEVIRKVLTEAGYKVIAIKENEIKLGWHPLLKKDLKAIEENLQKYEVKVNSVCQTTWSNKPAGINML